LIRKYEPGSQKVAGIIGIEVLMGCAVQLDFASHVMTVCTEPHAPIQIPGATILPMSQHKDMNAYFVTMTLQEGITTELLVDTGADETDIPMVVAQRLHPLATVSASEGTFYGLWITPTLLLPAVQLGTTTLTQVAVDSQPQPMPFCALGMDLLSRFRVTLDFPNRRMLLQRRPDDAQQPHLDGYTGIRLQQQGSDYFVESVDAGSPAQQAGVQAGDVVTDIDGHGVAGLPVTTAHALLNGFANTKAQIVVKREGGHSLTVSLDRLSIFVRPPAAVDGLFLDVPPHQPMQVIGLIKGCVGERAGLKRGDVIVKVNGHPTTNIDMDILAVEYGKPHLTLKVQRKGVATPLLLTLTAKPDPDRPSPK
jgi:PDZ domain/gag-polyprotein putative aspartyl protease